jgi:hypothetical protein
VYIVYVYKTNLEREAQNKRRNQYVDSISFQSPIRQLPVSAVAMVAVVAAQNDLGLVEAAQAPSQAAEVARVAEGGRAAHAPVQVGVVQERGGHVVDAAQAAATRAQRVASGGGGGA